MKGIVIKALESEVVFRPGNQTNAKYYAIITLNQTILSSLEHDIANKLLDIYFGVFAALLRKENAAPAATQSASGPNATGLRKHAKLGDERKASKLNKKARLRAKKQDEQSQLEEESHAKLVSAVLTGVNRAFPFSKVEDDVFDQHMDTLFRITHEGNFNTSIQALILIFQVSNAKQVQASVSCVLAKKYLLLLLLGGIRQILSNTLRIPSGPASHHLVQTGTVSQPSLPRVKDRHVGQARQGVCETHPASRNPASAIVYLRCAVSPSRAGREHSQYPHSPYRSGAQRGR